MSEIIECRSFKFPIKPDIHSLKLQSRLRNGRHEKREIWMLKRSNYDDDILLDIGAGLGLIAMTASRMEGIRSVVTVEANPRLIKLLKETFALNGTDNIRLVHGMLENRPKTKTRNFFLKGVTASSAIAPDEYQKKVRVPVRDFSNLLRESRATVITCDIEGGELDLFAGADLSNIRHIMLEIHPTVYGAEGVKRLFDTLSAKGLAYNAMCSGGHVVSFTRVEDAEELATVSNGRIPRNMWRNVRISESNQ